MKLPYGFDGFGMTDIGKVRRTNQDQFLIAELSKSMLVQETSLPVEDHTRLSGGKRGHLLLVADGMGGAPAGDLASSIAVNTVIRYVLNVMPWFFRLDGHEEDLRGELKRALERCQSSIEADVAANPEHEGMGTTLTMAYVIWPRLYVVHVGDSRCYLFRDSRLEQVTHDHTFAQQLADRGVLQKEAARQSQWSHVMWNIIGGKTPELRPELYSAELRRGDTLLLCTDGVTKHLPDPAVAALLENDRPVPEICRRIIHAAREQAGTDNITMVVARFGKPHPSPVTPEAETVRLPNPN